MIYFRTVNNYDRLVIIVNSPDTDHDYAEISPMRKGGSLVIANVINQDQGHRIILTFMTPQSIRQESYSTKEHLYSISLLETEIKNYISKPTHRLNKQETENE